MTITLSSYFYKERWNSKIKARFYLEPLKKDFETFSMVIFC